MVGNNFPKFGLIVPTQSATARHAVGAGRARALGQRLQTCSFFIAGMARPCLMAVTQRVGIIIADNRWREEKLKRIITVEITSEFDGNG